MLPDDPTGVFGNRRKGVQLKRWGCEESERLIVVLKPGESREERRSRSQ
jgi:hypothetical protein